ncbi:MAG: O-antigen ligase family protein, partial [Sphingomonadales bacterium]
VSAAVAWRPLSLTPDLTLNALLALLPATAALLGALYLDPRERLRLFQGLVAVACFSAVLGLLQLGAGGNAFRLYQETSLDSPVGLFANRNHQAVFLACALPVTGAIAGLKMDNNGDSRRTLLLAISIVTLLLLAVMSTGSRMGVALGLLGTVAAVFCYRVRRGRSARLTTQMRAVIAGGSAAMIGAAIFAAARSGAIERLAMTDTVNDTRAAMLRPLLETARAFMPFGSGFGSFDSVYRRFEPNALLSTIYMNQAHNEPLQLAIEGGVPALALLALFFWWWTRTALRIFRLRKSLRGGAIGMAATAITMILMASSLVDFPLRTPLLSAVFVVASLEMMRGSRIHRPAKPAQAPESRRTPAIGAAPARLRRQRRELSGARPTP